MRRRIFKYPIFFTWPFSPLSLVHKYTTAPPHGKTKWKLVWKMKRCNYFLWDNSRTKHTVESKSKIFLGFKIISWKRINYMFNLCKTFIAVSSDTNIDIYCYKKVDICFRKFNNSPLYNHWNWVLLTKIAMVLWQFSRSQVIFMYN